MIKRKPPEEAGCSGFPQLMRFKCAFVAAAAGGGIL